jgi:hypothetical protein
MTIDGCPGTVTIECTGIVVGKKVVKMYTGLGGNVLMGGIGSVLTCGGNGIVTTNDDGKLVGTYGDGIITTEGLAGKITTDVAGIDVGKCEIGMATGDVGKSVFGGKGIEVICGIYVGT